MKLLEEITVVCSREHDPVQPALEKVFPKLATAEGILPNNQTAIEKLNSLCKHASVSLDNADEVYEAVVSASAQGSLANALAMFQPGRDLISKTKLAAKAVRELRNSGKLMLSQTESITQTASGLIAAKNVAPVVPLMKNLMEIVGETWRLHQGKAGDKRRVLRTLCSGSHLCGGALLHACIWTSRAALERVRA